MNPNMQKMLQAFQSPQLYPHAATHIELIETHISWVILTGKYVYKIKKPVNMGFLDFSTLASRKRFCELELSLNKRLAPDYYLEVVPITGSFQEPALDGDGDIIEYALKMAQFPQDAELDRKVELGTLNEKTMNLLAEKIATFHQHIKVAGKSSQFGELAHVYQPVLNCYQEILKRINDNNIVDRINALRDWSGDEFDGMQDVFISRKEDGFIRECHGDLHLRNIAIVGEDVIAFDCIEFNEDLRWNDVISEIAFLIMDLHDHQAFSLASYFLNRYLELTGDYSGLRVLNYYLVYRAIVRAMVSCIRLAQDDIVEPEKSRVYEGFLKYIALAETYIATQTPTLFVTHGLSGSGKTTVSQVLLQAFPAIRIRSDIERKRLHGLKEHQREMENFQQGIYSSASSEQTYQTLLKLAGELLTARFSVIVDATFLRREHRGMFLKLAESMNIKFIILNCSARLNVMTQRIVQRNILDEDASDADLTVLKQQLNQNEEFSEREKSFLLNVNTEVEINRRSLLALLAK